MRIRPAELTDRAVVLELADRLSAFGPTTRTPAEVTTREKEVLAEALDGAPSPRDAEVFVAEDEGTAGDDSSAGVLGVLLMETRTDYFTRESHAHVSILAVAEEAEGRGIGKALLSYAERWANARGFRRLTLSVFADNLRAKGLYARCGWRPEMEVYFKTLSEPHETL